MVKKQTTILLADDEANFLRSLRDTLELEGYRVLTALDGVRALRILESESVDVLISDVRMPHMTGIELLRVAKRRWPRLLVFLLTGYGSIQDAVQSMRLGAQNYILKPVNVGDLLTNLREALRQEKRKSAEEETGHILVGQSRPIQELRQMIEKVGPSDLPVLITGESGTGKELVADSIYATSRRKGRPFVKLNCAAVPQNLLESELFGYEPGAFTDAKRRKKGKLELAHRGTLFLDEIGEMPFSMQAKLLRVLEEKSLERLGGSTTIHVDFRLISATNQNLEALIDQGKFRRDLFFRLNAIQLKTPALREIPEDIPLLAEYFLHEFCRKEGIAEPALTDETVDVLVRYSWPGNARELRNVIHRAVVLSQGGVITPEHLPAHLSSAVAAVSSTRSDLSLEEIEKRHIQRVLELTGHNKSRAADLLQIHRDTLYRKLRKYHLE